MKPKTIKQIIKELELKPKPKKKFKEIIRKDNNGNIIYRKDSYGYEYWKEYDSNNNIIHYKDSYGYEYWKEYNKFESLIHFKDSDGYEYWKECDSNNIIMNILKKDPDGSYELNGKQMLKKYKAG